MGLETPHDRRLLPFVSCIMPTYNRRAFIPFALHYFLRQDYTAKELIIVDDGTDAVGDLIPLHSQIRYHRLDGKHTLGGKRNLACRMARGSIILHWDDDDWSDSRRIAFQVRELLDAQADICGLDNLIFFDPKADRAWRYVYPDNNQPWVAGGTLCYLKSFWEGNPFPEIDVGEDGQFVWRAHKKQIHPLAKNDFYIAIKHDGNTSPKEPDPPLWKPLQSGIVRSLLGNDLAFYKGLTDKFPSDYRAGKFFSTAEKGRVTVSLPYFHCKPFIRRAVESILAQTHIDFRLIVTNDGDPTPPWEELAHIDDPRLIRFDMESNHGRYFADAVALSATNDPYFMIQDADDCSAPKRMATLLQQLRAEHAIGAVSAHMRQSPDKQTGGTKENYPDVNRPLTDTFEHRTNHHGLYKTDALRSIGGYYSGFRIGYDTLLVNLLLMTGRLAYVDEALYYRTIRADSLTSSTDTGLQSPMRQQVTQKLERLYKEALSVYHSYVAGELDHADLCHRIRRICAQHITKDDQSVFEYETRRLQEKLNSIQMPRPAAKRAIPKRAAIGLIDDPRLDWSGWAIGKPIAHQLQKHLESARPKRILELGSGTSSVVLADYASRHRATVVSLGHESTYYDTTDYLLQDFDLREYIDLRLAPLKPYSCPDGRSYPFYDTNLQGLFDFVFIDGPPLRSGREATLFVVVPHLAPGWTVWLHDASRSHEKKCVALWERYHPFHKELTHPEPRGLYILTAPKPLPCHTNDGAGMGISILTGGRLNLLQQTINQLQQQYRELLEAHFVVALVNGYDPDAIAYLQQQNFVDVLLEYTDGILPIGEATSRLMRHLLQQDIDTVLHLEDDWACAMGDPSWLSKAQTILKQDPDVGQIRLRHTDDRVLPYHMVTRRPITWEHCDGFMKAQSAHFTFNPSLVRAQDVAEIFPCRNEYEAQVNFLRLGLASVQLIPGIFYHIGERQKRIAVMN